MPDASLRGIDGNSAAHGTAHQDSTGAVPTSPILRPVRHTDAADVARHAARHHYRQTLAEGQPCTGRQLAERFGMSERWGRYQARRHDEPLPHPRPRPHRVE